MAGGAAASAVPTDATGGADAAVPAIASRAADVGRAVLGKRAVTASATDLARHRYAADVGRHPIAAPPARIRTAPGGSDHGGIDASGAGGALTTRSALTTGADQQGVTAVAAIARYAAVEVGGDASTTAAAIAEQHSAVAAIAAGTSIDTRRSRAAATASADQARIATHTAIGTLAAVPEQQPAVTAVARCAGAIRRGVGAVADEHADQRTDRITARACRRQRQRGGRLHGGSARGPTQRIGPATGPVAEQG
ncbi:hypothetical protein B5P44_19270 [Mycobacterium sp. CBMA 213]|nr:hypothetical protein [Mycolicibacterium sp. CBMA 213]